MRCHLGKDGSPKYFCQNFRFQPHPLHFETKYATLNCSPGARGQFWTNLGANSNLPRVVGICLKSQKKCVSKAEFPCKCVFCRPEWKKTQILKMAPNFTNGASQVSLKVFDAIFLCKYFWKSILMCILQARFWKRLANFS